MPDLKQARQAKKYSLQHMGDVLGVTRERYRQMEQHPDRLRIDQARAICHELNIDPRLFFT